MMEGEAHAAGMMGPGRGPGLGQARLPVRDVHASTLLDMDTCWRWTWTRTWTSPGDGHGHLLGRGICWMPIAMVVRKGARGGCYELRAGVRAGTTSLREVQAAHFNLCDGRKQTESPAWDNEDKLLRALEAFDPRGQRLHPTRTT